MMMRYRSQSPAPSLALFSVAAVMLLMGPATPAQECLPAPDGLVGWWPGDGNGDDIENGNHGTLLNGVGFAAGMVGQGFLFDGHDDVVEIAPSPILDFEATTGEFTKDAWIKLTAIQSHDMFVLRQERAIAFVGAGGPPNSSSAPVGRFFNAIGGGAPNLCVSSFTPLLDEFHHYAVTYESGVVRMYVDGQPADACGNRTLEPQTGFTNTIGGAVVSDPSSQSRGFAGVIDEVEFFDRALSQSEIQAIFEAGSAGKCKDEDGDGFRPPDDCDETDPAINPDAVELPGNFVDENCDGNLGDCDPCFTWRNHGEYVRCVSHGVEDLVTQGHITEEDGDALVSSAARSDIGKKGYAPPECQ